MSTRDKILGSGASTPMQEPSDGDLKSRRPPQDSRSETIKALKSGNGENEMASSAREDTNSCVDPRRGRKLPWRAGGTWHMITTSAALGRKRGKLETDGSAAAALYWETLCPQLTFMSSKSVIPIWGRLEQLTWMSFRPLMKFAVKHSCWWENITQTPWIKGREGREEGCKLSVSLLPYWKKIQFVLSQ